MFTPSDFPPAPASHRPVDHPLPIHRRTQGGDRTRAVMANRFRDEWKRKNENGIAPPRLPGWNCDRLEGDNIDVDE